MKKILTVSLFAMMAVSAANAEIASTNYVENRTGDLAFTANSSIASAGTLTAAANTLAAKVDAMVGGELTIKDNAITSGMIKNGEVATDDLANNAVTNAKLADNAVQTENIKDANVTEAKLSAELATKINKKADQATTLDGYGIDDAYTKTQADEAFMNAGEVDAKINELNLATTYEALSNKTTEVTEQSTDAQYPTAKAVQTAITNATGNLSDDVTDLLADYATSGDLDSAVEAAANDATSKANAAEANAKAYAQEKSAKLSLGAANGTWQDLTTITGYSNTGMYSLVMSDGAIKWEKVNPGN